MNLMDRRRALMMAIGGGLDMFDLIGEATIALGDYTNITTAEDTDTGINISNTDYAWGIAIITCDTPVVGANDWGASFAVWGRLKANAAVSPVTIMQRGTSTLSFADLTSNSGQGTSAYGVTIAVNAMNVKIVRKCHGTACPLCRAGNYTVKVYGLKSL